jgi:hypothetical protein
MVYENYYLKLCNTLMKGWSVRNIVYTLPNIVLDAWEEAGKSEVIQGQLTKDERFRVATRVS